MRAVVTRVEEASVTIDGRINGKIGQGFLVLLGIAPEDTVETAVYLADRVCGVRVFEDEKGKMNLNLEKVAAARDLAGRRNRRWRFLFMRSLWRSVRHEAFM